MIKTIFIPTAGSNADDAVFATALEVGQALRAHLNFYHVRQLVWEAAVRERHFEFREGPSINAAVGQVRDDEALHARKAREHAQQFCNAHAIPLLTTPSAAAGVTAEISEETGEPAARLIPKARHHDLVVVGRRARDDRMPANLIELLLVGSGRPILIAPGQARSFIGRSVVVGWKETPEAARAVAAAMPLLQAADRVVLVRVEEDAAAKSPCIDDLAAQLAWHGVGADVRYIPMGRCRAEAALADVAAEVGAGLLVVGGYGHKPLREAAFGGVTSALVAHADLPVFMMH
ncbi:MAG: universal stress protein [Steroidobacterales bacterium]